jgi:penicillin-binding protein 1C
MKIKIFMSIQGLITRLNTCFLSNLYSYRMSYWRLDHRYAIARLRWDIQSNTFSGKIEQIARALQLSRHYSKPALLEVYLNLVPYGGNIEGIRAASLIYFNKPASQLSFAEAITLALVPQNPRKRNSTSEEGLLAIQAAKAPLLEHWFERKPQDKQMISLINLPLFIRKTS